MENGIINANKKPAQNGQGGVKMAETKPKVNLAPVALGIACVVLLVIIIGLYLQNGSLKDALDKQKSEAETLLVAQTSLKQQAKDADAKLAEQVNLAASLQRQLDEANAVIQSLTEEQAGLVERTEESVENQPPMEPPMESPMELPMEQQEEAVPQAQ